MLVLDILVYVGSLSHVISIATIFERHDNLSESKTPW